MLRLTLIFLYTKPLLPLPACVGNVAKYLAMHSSELIRRSIHQPRDEHGSGESKSRERLK
jgi:hypothetical protein